MRVLSDSIEIKTTPKMLFQWFLDIEGNYESWHPDHVSWDWVDGEPFQVGSKAISKEYLHGKIHTLKAVVTNVKENELIEYKFLFPESIIVPGGSFKFTYKDSICIFTATLSVRFGGLISKIFKNRMRSTLKHMKEEGKNLKRIIEDEK